MGKIVVAIVGFICFVNIVVAQDNMLVIEGKSPNLYITHKIAPKENYYSIGRMYNVSPKELAPFNNLDFEKGLNVGETIKIPLTQSNFAQEGVSKGHEALIPVYHVVQPKEGLYRVSLNYNKVSLEQLKKWNNLSSDAVSNGTKLIIGYLQLRKDQSSLSKNEANIEKIPATINKEPEAHVNKADTPKATVPVADNSGIVKTGKPDADNTTAVKDKIVEVKNASVTRAGINFNGGRFKDLYEDQRNGKTEVTESGLSGVFKSTSGWQDGKYYCFHNGAQPGTILKITNTANDKSIYAKVLDLIPDINKNAGLTLHISNSAAEELGVTASQFDCAINYSK